MAMSVPLPMAMLTSAQAKACESLIMAERMKYGVMATPALVIDGKVVSIGRMLSVEQIEKLIKDRL